MKKLSKKFGLAAVAVFLVLMLLPIQVFASATGDSFSSVSNTSLQLNAATNGTPYVGLNITVWANTGHSTQRWRVVNFPGTSNNYMLNDANADVTISLGSSNMVVLATRSLTASDTQAVRFVNEGMGINAYIKHGLVLPAYILCLTAGASSGAQCYWTGPTGSNNQLWYWGMFY